MRKVISRLGVAAFAFGVAALTSILILPHWAYAAGRLVSSVPTPDAVLAAAPSAVELSFSGPVNAGLSHVSVFDSAGVQLNAAGVVNSDAATLRQEIARPRNGVVTVAYHAVLRDGSQAKGVIRFSVGTGEPPAPGAPALGLPSHDHGVDPVGASLLVVDAVVLVGAVLLLMMRRPGPDLRAIERDGTDPAGPSA